MSELRESLIEAMQSAWCDAFEGWAHYSDLSRRGLEALADAALAHLPYHMPWDGWNRVDAGATPLDTWLLTYRSGESGPTISMLRQLPHDIEPHEWIAEDGRTTVTHKSYAPPTHWRLLPPNPDEKGEGE